MIKSELYFKSKDGEHFEEIRDLASSKMLEGWQEYFWAGLYLNAYAPDGTYYELITETLEEAFFQGLSNSVDRECYLKAIKVLGKLYLELQQYDLALNMLQMLIINDTNVPDWVNLRFSYAQLHSMTAKRLIDEPSYFFNRIENINKTDKNIIAQRNAIFKEYLTKSLGYYKNENIKLDLHLLHNKASEYGLLSSDAWKDFSLEFNNENDSYNIEKEINNDSKSEDKISYTISINNLTQESTLRICNCIQEINEKCGEEINDLGKIQLIIDELLAGYPQENLLVTEAYSEGVISLINDAVNETDINQQIALENACKIFITKCGLQEKFAINVVSKIAKILGYSDSTCISDKEKNEKSINNFMDKIVDELKKENDELINKMHELQNEMADLLEKNQSYEELLKKKNDIIKQITKNDDRIDNIVKYTAESSIIGHDLIDDNKKILVIGQTVVSVNKLIGIAKNYGYEKNDFVFWNDYEKIKSYAERMAGGSYIGIIAGPMPHKVANLGNYTSLIEKMKQPGYPYLEEARSAGGELKITKSSFRKALESVTKHLIAIQ